jgi:hypothetical protein
MSNEEYQEIKNQEFEGLKNFTRNIKPVILKIKDGKKLTQSELNQIKEFYLEVAANIF